VPANSYGIVVEGPYDAAVYPTLIRRILNREVPVIARLCGGKVSANNILLALLGELQGEMAWRRRQNAQKNPELEVEVWRRMKALVIRDSDGKDPQALKAEMAEKVGKRRWEFSEGAHVCIVRRELEVWLLADAAAVGEVAIARGGRAVAEVQGTLEDFEDPKQRLRRLLTDAGVEYTETVCAEIAASANLETIGYRCPSFRTFEQRVTDC